MARSTDSATLRADGRPSPLATKSTTPIGKASGLVIGATISRPPRLVRGCSRTYNHRATRTDFIMKSKISVVIAWCDRVALRTSLSQNWPYFRRAGAEVLLVNCGGNRSLARRLVSVSAGNGPIRVIHLAAGSFNKSLALNVGSSLATSSHLCFLDADVVISPTLLDQLRARATGDTFSTVRDVVESQLVGQTSETALSETSQHLAFTLRDGRRARILISRTGYRPPRRTGPGLVCLSRRHFVSVGGMNAELKGWGWEDLDLIIRLSLKLGLKRREQDRKSTRLNSSHQIISYAVFC